MTNETMSAKASAFSIDAIMTATPTSASVKSTPSQQSPGEFLFLFRRQCVRNFNYNNLPYN
ncbi:unnamed protein product [Hydatigera taeniaeformis]|uniref:Uncharacterized protein n=1 Tax=Hydatigena taeniaeformis TaxID=6205 RepID=A0A0R3WWP6_HYDTA|nr:unnamed protein product [Hydatigera taeniaeformis]